MNIERVTVTFPVTSPATLTGGKNRSRFVAEAVRHELDRRRRASFADAAEPPP
jgi:metal-responsive CopG/Arc/MetJ family transcriptional regulator